MIFVSLMWYKYSHPASQYSAQKSHPMRPIHALAPSSNKELSQFQLVTNRTSYLFLEAKMLREHETL